VDEPEQTAAETDVFELVYQGPDVENGTMSSGELVEVFTGLTRAFRTVAHESELGDQYDLRLRDIDHRSFHLIFEAIAYVKANPAPAAVIVVASSLTLQAVTNTVSGAYKIITDIGAMLQAEKKARGERTASSLTARSDSHFPKTWFS
jgi:hypothetical protein